MIRLEKFLDENTKYIRWVGIIYIFLWTIIRCKYINVAFFWDEAWVYAPSLRIMMENGPSLLPDAIPEFYSRGHPLLFHFLGGIWLKLFGTSYVTYHLFGLTISIIFLFTIFFTVADWVDHWVSFGVLILVSTNKLFFGEAASVMPEVLVGLFSILSLKYYLKEKYLLYFLFAGLLVLTKESGIILPFSLIIYFAYKTLYKESKKIDSQFILVGSKIGSPLAVFGIFLCVQYSYKGWFLFPEHIGMMTLTTNQIIEKIALIYNWTFEEDKTYLFAGVISYILIFCGNKMEKQKQFIALLGIFIGLFTLITFSKEKEGIAVIGFFVLFGAFNIIHKMITQNMNNNEKIVIAHTLVFICFYTLFCASNFITVRYLIPILPFYYLYFSYILRYFTMKNNLKFIFIIVGISLIIAPTNFVSGSSTNLFAQQGHVDVRNSLVKYLESKNLYDENIGVPEFVTLRILQDPFIGMLSGKKIFSKADWSIENKTYIIICNLDQYPVDVPRGGKYELLKKWENGVNWIELWKKRLN
jgi:hypothetical protein